MTEKLEILLRKAGRELADYQVARIFKVPEEWARTPCDFFGYTSSGRAILIEAKEVSRASLPIGCSPGLKVHQWEALMEANRANCLALLCWACGDTCATMTMDMVVELSKGRRSIAWKDIPEQYLHPMRGRKAHLGLLDPWLDIEMAAY